MGRLTTLSPDPTPNPNPNPNPNPSQVGIGLICGGCALVGKRKTMPKRYVPAP